MSGSKTKILLFSEETKTASFILDVLSSLDYQVLISDPFNIVSDFDPVIIIINLDHSRFSFETFLSIKEKYNESFFIGFGNKESQNYEPSYHNLIHVFLDSENIRLKLMSHILELKRFYLFKKQFNKNKSKIIGSSQIMQKLFKDIERVLPHQASVLIQGETGVGKELVARAIASVHPHFVVLNCSAIPENLFESELFGHIRGAFTGANIDRIGLFEEADNGVLFLDEIGDMPYSMQAKLLRAIQENEIRPIGSNKTKKVSVRVIAATNKDLKAEVEKGCFREDLYYRLHVIPIYVPSLVERIEDIEELVEYFIKQHAPNGKFYTISKEALEKLKEYHWPGNIRELENKVHQAIVFANSSLLSPQDFNIHMDTKKTNEDKMNWRAYNYENFKEKQRQEEIEFLNQKYIDNNASITQTANALGMNRTTLHNRVSRLGFQFKKPLL